MIFGSKVGSDSIYSYPYESRKITVQEMMENIPLYDSEKGKSSNERTEKGNIHKGVLGVFSVTYLSFYMAYWYKCIM